MWQKIVLAVGVAGVLLAGLGLLIFGIIVATSSGRIRADEAAPGFLGGGCCCSLSLIVAVVGLVLVLKNRKPKPGFPVDGQGKPPTP